MKVGAFGAALLTLLLGTHPTHWPRSNPAAYATDNMHHGMMMSMDMRQQMRLMDSVNARLDTLMLR